MCRTKQDQHHETSKRHPACEQGRFRATGNGCVQIWKNTVLRDDDEFSFALSSNTDKKLPIAKLTIEGMRVDFLVDSETTVNVRDAKDFRQRNLRPVNGHVPLKRTNARLFAFGSTQPQSLQGKFDTLIELNPELTSGNTSLLRYATSADLGLITLH